MTHASEKKILVVDDEPDVRNFLAACLEDCGFSVETAKDGVEALEKIEKKVPDLITLDMVMPRKSGIQMMRTLRANDAWASIPVIVITAHAHDELGSDDIKEFSAFAVRHRPKFTMDKPVTPEKLVQAVMSILNVKVSPSPDFFTKGSDDRDLLKKLIDQSNPDTLQKIREILKT
jgi:two-component system alkaline phosphatase synthesis response regulator PhoP